VFLSDAPAHIGSAYKMYQDIRMVNSHPGLHWIMLIAQFPVNFLLRIFISLLKLNTGILGNIGILDKLIMLNSDQVLFTSITLSTILILALSILFSVIITAKIISRLIGKDESNISTSLLLMSVLLHVVQPVFLPFFNERLFYGQFGGNPWHNPTYLVMRPFVLAFILQLLKKVKYSNLAAGLLLCATLIKPSFTMIFIPFSFAFLLYSFWQGKYRNKSISLIVLCIPSILVMAFLYLLKYADKGIATTAEPAHILLAPFGVWNLYTKSVIISTLLALLFPALYATIIRVYTIRGYLLSTMLLYLIAFAIAAGFAESGRYFIHGNFFWSYDIAIYLVFVYFAALYIKYRSTMLHKGLTASGLRTRMLVIDISLSMHALSGIYMFYHYTNIRSLFYA